MSCVTTQRCVVAFLLALCASSSTALMAWGVIELPLVEPGIASPGAGLLWHHWDPSAWLFEPMLWMGGVLLGVALWGQWILVQRHRRVTDLSWPWRALLVALACRAVVSVLQSLSEPDQLLFAAQVSQSGIAAFLFLGLMAERLDVAWGQARTVLAAGILLALAALWCHGSGQLSGRADARALLLLQLLPVLIAPAGVLGLPARAFGRHETAAMCIAYALTLVATWLPALHIDPVPTWLNQWVQTVPMWSIIVLTLLLILPIIRALQTNARPSLQARAERRCCDQMSASRFTSNALELVEALPTTNRRNRS